MEKIKEVKKENEDKIILELNKKEFEQLTKLLGIPFFMLENAEEILKHTAEESIEILNTLKEIEDKYFKEEIEEEVDKKKE